MKKMIDIHTKKEVEDNSKYEKQISGNTIYDYILENIDFPLPEKSWIAIDKSFADIWNNLIGVGGYFYWDEISKQIYDNLKTQKILIEYERVEKIVNLMQIKIEEIGGLME